MGPHWDWGTGPVTRLSVVFAETGARGFSENLSGLPGYMYLQHHQRTLKDPQTTHAGKEQAIGIVTFDMSTS